MGYMTDERRMIQETARAFALKEVLPLANKLDPEKGDIPRELIAAQPLSIDYEYVHENMEDYLHPT